MENNRNDVITEEKDVEMERTYYILLSLCREYSISLKQNKASKSDCLAKIKQIRTDIKQLDRCELIRKTEQIYFPILKELKEKSYN